MQISLPVGLFLSFLILKLCHVIVWSWWWVFFPLFWFPIFFLLMAIPLLIGFGVVKGLAK